MNNDLKKLLLCLKWDVDNIEDLNNKRDYISSRIADIQELVKNCSIPNVSERFHCSTPDCGITRGRKCFEEKCEDWSGR